MSEGFSDFFGSADDACIGDTEQNLFTIQTDGPHHHDNHHHHTEIHHRKSSSSSSSSDESSSHSESSDIVVDGDSSDEDDGMDVIQPTTAMRSPSRACKIPADPLHIRVLACQEREARVTREEAQVRRLAQKFSDEVGLYEQQSVDALYTQVKKCQLRAQRLETSNKILDLWRPNTHLAGLIVPERVGTVYLHRKALISDPQIMSALARHINPRKLLELCWQGRIQIASESTTEHHTVMGICTQTQNLLFYVVVRHDSLRL
jgi:hypothetical protein